MTDVSAMDWSQFAIHPVAFAFVSAFSLSDNVMTDLVVYQTCRTMLKANNTDCNILHTNSTSDEARAIQKRVQPHTANIFMIISCIVTIFPTILCLFLGPWSDKNGRKPLLLIPLIGQFISFGSMAFISSLDIDPYWLLLPYIPSALCGGFPAILLTFFCYITDVTDEENRVWNLSCLDTVFITGMLIGLLSGSVIFTEYGYSTVFSVSTGFCLFSILYTFFWVKETIINENSKTLKSVFDLSLAKEFVRAVSKKRDGFDKYLTWSCILGIAIYVVVMQGNVTVAFLFTSSKLGWDISDYSIYSATQLLLSIFGMQFLIKLIGSFLKLPETMIIVLACLSSSASNLTKAFAGKPWHMYFSSGIGMLTASTVPALRAIISKSVPRKDLGKVFSLTTIMEMIVPLATTPLYLFIYTQTMNLYPCPVWFLSAVLPFVIIILTIFIEQRWRRLKDSLFTPFVAIENQ